MFNNTYSFKEFEAELENAITKDESFLLDPELDKDLINKSYTNNNTITELIYGAKRGSSLRII